MRRRISVVPLFLVILLTYFVPPSSAIAASPFVPLARTIEHAMTIRIALVGISEVDRNQLLWNLEPEIRPVIQVNYNPQGMEGLSYGTVFTVKYDVITVSDEATTSLKDFLKSIAKTEKVPKYLETYGSWSSASDSGSYATLDALKTEEWINSHISSFGGIPEDGYTLIVANVADISSLYHYYNMTYTDLDKASSKAKYAKRAEIWPVVNWMYSWGGRHRFYYLDLSAGDPKYDYSMVGHVPIQDFETRYLGSAKVKFKQDISTVTEYVADYVAEAVRNLVLPSYVYAPTFATCYKVSINVFDQVGGVVDNIDDYLSAEMIKDAFEEIVPYASWDVSVNAVRLSDDSGLESVVSNSILFSRDVTGFGNDKVHIDYYDYRQVYWYLQSHSSQYYDSGGDCVVLPVFEFVFRGGGRFAYTWEEYIGSSSRGADWPDRTFGGISLGDMVIIGYPERNIFSFGYELTQVTIHELGHSIGLMHPHSYGYTEDYVNSAMSYLTYEYGFSQFDIDALQRAHADSFLAQVQVAVETSRGAVFQSSEAQGLLQQALSGYERGLSSYSRKDYRSAIEEFQSLPRLLTEAFDAEVVSIERALTETAVRSESAKRFLEQSSSLLESAKQQKQAGTLGLAYQSLTQASQSIRNALDAEAQADEFARAVASQFQSAVALGAAVGIGVGVVIGLAVAMMLKRTKSSK